MERPHRSQRSSGSAKNTRASKLAVTGLSTVGSVLCRPFLMHIPIADLEQATEILIGMIR